LNQSLLSNEHNFILRLKNKENIKNNAITLYMYLKSEKAQIYFKAKVSNSASYQRINKQDLEEMDIPTFDDNVSQIVENFNTEQKLYSEIYETTMKIHTLHQAFDDKDTEDLGHCRMCRVSKATHLRIDTWQPFKKGVPMCDKCSNNIMF